MNKLRDLLYDKNDIFVALIIVLIAALIIVWRINTIMDLPQTMAATQQQDENTHKTDQTDHDDQADADDGQSAAGNETPAGSPSNDADEPEYYSLYINYGDSVDTVASYLVNLGFFASKQDCINAINQAGVAQKLQAGTHTIPKNATPEEALKKITTPGA